MDICTILKKKVKLFPPNTKEKLEIQSKKNWTGSLCKIITIVILQIDARL